MNTDFRLDPIFRNTETQYGDIKAPQLPRMAGAGPVFSNLKAVEIPVPEEMKQGLFDLMGQSEGMGGLTRLMNHSAEQIKAISLDPATGNISVSMEGASPTNIAAYDLDDSFVTRATIFQPQSMQISRFATDFQHLTVLQKIDTLIKKAGAFRAEGEGLKLAKGIDGGGKARAALIDHLHAAEQEPQTSS